MEKLKILVIAWIATLVFFGCYSEEIIEIDQKPQLEIQVFDESGNAVNGALVMLFASEDDWESKSNSIQQKSTDSSGKVLFQELSESIYFFHVSKGEMDNYYDVVTFANPLQMNEIKTITTTIK